MSRVSARRQLATATTLRTARCLFADRRRAVFQQLPVRVPSRMTADVLKAFQAEIIGRDLAAQRLRVSPAELDQLAERRASDDE